MLSWVVIFGFDPRRPAHCRHVTKVPSPQLLLFPRLTNCDARRPFRTPPLRTVFALRIRVGFDYSQSGTHPPLTILTLVLSFHAFTGTPFCNPFVFMVFHRMGGCTPSHTLPFGSRRVFSASQPVYTLE